jgi:hypothetical protein
MAKPSPVFLLILVAGMGLAQDTVWTRRFNGGRTEYSERGGVDPLGGAVIVGSTRHPVNGNIVIELAKYTAAGEFIWSQTFDTTGDNYEYGATVDANGNTIVVGTDYSAALVLKYDRDGNLAWVRRFTPDPTGYPWFCGVVTDDSANIYAAGGFTPDVTYDEMLYLAKLSAAGDSVWACTLNLSSTDDAEGITTLATTRDVMIVGAGRIGDTRTDSLDLLTLKFAPDGETSWTRRLDFKFEDHSSGMAVDRGGNVYVTGYCGHWPELPDTCITVKYTSIGDTVWTRRLGAAGDTRGYDIDVGPDSNLLVCASTVDPGGGQTAVLISYTPQGDTVWTYRYRPDTSDWCRALEFDGPDAFYLFGGCVIDSAHPGSDLLLMKLSYGADISEPSQPLTLRRQQGASIIRNVLRVGVGRPDIGQEPLLMDITGRKVLSLQPGDNDIRRLAPGVYFVRSADVGERSVVRKIVIQK